MFSHKTMSVHTAKFHSFNLHTLSTIHIIQYINPYKYIYTGPFHPCKWKPTSTFTNTTPNPHTQSFHKASTADTHYIHSSHQHKSTHQLHGNPVNVSSYSSLGIVTCVSFSLHFLQSWRLTNWGLHNQLKKSKGLGQNLRSTSMMAAPCAEPPSLRAVHTYMPRSLTCAPEILRTLLSTVTLGLSCSLTYGQRHKS